MQIFVQKNGQQLGPYSFDQVNEYLAQGSLLATDPAWHDELTGWTPLNQIVGVVDPGSPAPPAFNPATFNPNAPAPPVAAQSTDPSTAPHVAPVIAGDAMGFSHDVSSGQNCPNGHGPLRDWEGHKRCWECGWPNEQQTTTPQKNTGNPNSSWDLGDVILAVLVVVGIAGTLVAIYHLTSKQNVGVSLWNIFAVITWLVLYFRIASWFAGLFSKK
jgi:hypothetical protein